MQINLAGIVSLSTVDFPGHACMTIFLRGCDKRCPWCHNKEYQCGETFVDIDLVFHAIDEAASFVSAVTLSGGEPLLQLDAVKEIASYAHNRGLKVGIHTALPDELEKVKYVIDYAWISDSTIHPGEVGSHVARWYNEI